VVRLIGRDSLKYFKEKGLGETVLPDEALEAINMYADMLQTEPENLQEKGIDVDKMTFPKYPVNISEKEGEYDLIPKLKMSEDGDSAELHVQPDDIKGSYDFSIDVQSMTVNADEERRQARQTAVSLLVSNPNILELLKEEGTKPKFKELFISWLDDLGFTDAERYFEQTGGGGAGQGGEEGGPESIQELLKTFGGGKLNQGQQQEALQEVNQQGGQSSPGLGANQLAKVSEPGSSGQEQANLGQPNPKFLNRLVDKYGNQ